MSFYEGEWMKVYLDNASSTMIAPEVVREMLPFLNEMYGSPASLHNLGVLARDALEKARERVSELIGASVGEIHFTSGEAESNNIAIKGFCRANRKKGRHIITTNIEHPSILQSIEALKKEGFEATSVPVNERGIIEPSRIEDALRRDTILVSLMYANHEIGTLHPIEEIGRMLKERGIAFHVDATYAAGRIPVNVDSMEVDLLSLSSHTIHGPKGKGALYIREGTSVEPLMNDGFKGIVLITMDVAGAVGFGRACKIAKERMGDMKRVQKMRDELIKGITEMKETYLNGDGKMRLPDNANFRFIGIEGEALVLSLDAEGIYASTGSACSSKELKASHVLLGLGLSPVEVHGSLRLSLSRYNTMEEVEYVLEKIPPIVGRLREMSPVWREVGRGKGLNEIMKEMSG